MIKKPLPLKSVRIRNFKAIHDSGTIGLTPLTVFVGNNGAGKSSIIEGMEFVQRMVKTDLEQAIGDWHEFAHIWNKTAPHHHGPVGNPWAANAMSFEFSGHTGSTGYSAKSEISILLEKGGPDFKKEFVKLHRRFERTREGPGDVEERSGGGTAKTLPPLDFYKSLLSMDGHVPVDEWSFLNLNPALMGGPKKRIFERGAKMLSKSGMNLAEYLLAFYEADKSGFNDLIDMLRMVLPFARELRPTVVKDLIESRIFLQMREKGKNGEFDLPSWVLSTGTLRILALLASLRHPTLAPKVLFVDELENGLDPRTIGLLIEEIRSAVESGSTQVIATTHSPYLMDQLALKHLVLVERKPDEPPTFTRPAEDEQVQEWSRQFAPGRLYAMGTLSNRE